MSRKKRILSQILQQCLEIHAGQLQKDLDLEERLDLIANLIEVFTNRLTAIEDGLNGKDKAAISKATGDLLASSSELAKTIAENQPAQDGTFTIDHVQ